MRRAHRYSPYSKRELLLEQIRQKDQIIDKLLQQIRIQNPSQPPINPSDTTSESQINLNINPNPIFGTGSTNPDVIEWMEKVEASVRAGEGPFAPDGRADRDTDDTGSDFGSDDGDGIGMGGSAEESLDPRYAGMLGAGAAGHGMGDREKLHSLPDPTAPLGLIARLSLDTRSGRSKSRSAGSRSSHGGGSTTGEVRDDADDDLGVANTGYFLPGPAANVDLRAALMVSQPPEILVHGLVSPQDVDNLFAIFYDKLNPFLSILDPKLHTPSSTFSRCPFLFTVICAISSRYYTAKAHIYPIAMHFAKSAAAKNLIDGWKCVELCQAYILMSLYSMPAKKWEDDRSWLYLGLAIRIATDLNLHHPTAIKSQGDELHEREILNRTRTWIILFNLDRSMSTQFGKPTTIREDHIIHHSQEWYKQSKFNSPYDIHLVYYSALLRIVARFHEKVYNGPMSVRPDLDVHKVINEFDRELEGFQVEAQNAFNQALDADQPGSVFRGKLTPYLVNYSRLVLFSFGFQKTYQHQESVAHDDEFLHKCLVASTTVLDVFVNQLAPSGYMRYSPDGHFVFASFACAFLIKLLRNNNLTEHDKKGAIEYIKRLINTLSSPEVAIDERHTPKLYSRFLASLLGKQLGETMRPVLTLAATGPTPPGEDSSHSSVTVDANPPLDTPTISVEYDQNDGDRTHVQLLHNPLDAPSYPTGAYHLQQHDPRNHQIFDERFSTTSSTIGGAPSTHHGDNEGQAQNGEMNPQDMLATMHLLSNPGFYDHMLMPPFAPPRWTHEEAYPPPLDSGGGNRDQPQTFYHQQPQAHPQHVTPSHPQLHRQQYPIPPTYHHPPS